MVGTRHAATLFIHIDACAYSHHVRTFVDASDVRMHFSADVTPDSMSILVAGYIAAVTTLRDSRSLASAAPFHLRPAESPSPSLVISP